MDVDLLARFLPSCDKEDVREVLESVYSAHAVHALMLSSIKNGDIEAFQWLHSTATQSTATDMHLPGDIAIVIDDEYLRLPGDAVMNDDLVYMYGRCNDGLRYIDGSRVYAEIATLCGELPHLCFISQYQPQFKWSRKLLSMAAERGHLHVLEWARAQRPVCPWGNNRSWNTLSVPCAVFLERNKKPLNKSSKYMLNSARKTSLACCLKRKGLHTALVCHILSLA